VRSSAALGEQESALASEYIFMFVEVAEVLAELLLRLAVYFLAHTLCLAAATPLILISAPFRPGRIRSDYAAVRAWFDEWASRLLL
jgi:glutathione S-transferase